MAELKQQRQILYDIGLDVRPGEYIIPGQDLIQLIEHYHINPENIKTEITPNDNLVSLLRLF